MAIHEIEPQEGLQNSSVTPEEAEASPRDAFRTSLHRLVTDIESEGLSALSSLLAIRAELRERRISLMRQSLALEQRLRDEPGFQNKELLAELSRNQEEQILVYHNLEWLEGYVRDRPTSH